MSLSQLLKTYESKKKSSQKSVQSIRKDIQRCIQDETISALKTQNYKVNNIHKNQQAIETKFKKQQQLLAEFRQNQDMWRSLYQQLNRALMEAGDLVHYAGYVQAEISQLLGQGTVAQYLKDAEKEEGAQVTEVVLKEKLDQKGEKDTQTPQNIQENKISDVNSKKQAQQ